MRLSADIKQFINEHESDDIHALALQSSHYPGIDITFVIQQIRGRKIAKNKIPSWYENQDIIYPKHLSLEQCSSEYTALYKANLISGNILVDLTGGMGVDIAFLSQRFKKAIYIEQQTELVKIAEHNFSVSQHNNIQVIDGDGLTYLKSMEPVDCIYLDPARRDTKGRKTILIEDCTPNILEIEALLESKAKTVMIKLSPMLDISLAVNALNNISDIHVISHNNECKELLFIKKNLDSTTSCNIYCINIQGNRTDTFTFHKKDEEAISISYSNKIGKYLYEPNASIIKAGAYKSVAHQYSIDKLQINSHLYTSDNLIENFQGRKFRILTVSSLNKNELKDNLRKINQANISTRNFPLSSQELKKRLNLKDGGDIYIFGTTLSDNRKVILICDKL